MGMLDAPRSSLLAQQSAHVSHCVGAIGEEEMRFENDPAAADIESRPPIELEWFGLIGRSQFKDSVLNRSEQRATDAIAGVLPAQVSEALVKLQPCNKPFVELSLLSCFVFVFLFLSSFSPK